MQILKNSGIIKKEVFLVLIFLLMLFGVDNNTAGGNERDPFMPPARVSRKNTTAKTAPVKKVETRDINFLLTGIHLGRDTVAIINNKVVHVGDFIGEAKVIAIEQGCVRLEKNSEEFALEMKDQ